MKIYGLNKTTLLDYPGRVAATIFLGGALCHRSFILFKKTSGNPGRRVRHRR